jgi:mannitol/fructose-specific phosphotransferase system IIA component (Ntr-type)
MNLSRFLTEDLIKLEMTTVIDPLEEAGSVEKWRLNAKEQILSELVDLLEEGHRLGNKNKLLIDFFNREKKASTAIGHGVAVPHIRSLQAKDFMMAFARSTEGYDFDAPDKEPVHMFFIMAAPPYDDSLYLRVFRSLAEMLQYETFREELMSVESPGEVIRVVRSME